MDNTIPHFSIGIKGSRKGSGSPMYGKTHTEEWKREHSKKMKAINMKPPLHKGEDHWNWKGGIAPKNINLRRTAEFMKWRKAVLLRDGHQCVSCGSKENLEADHLVPFHMSEKSRFEVKNGRTLCKSCHLFYGWRKRKITKFYEIDQLWRMLI